MLSDHEREALQEVERRFRSEDPRFTRAFEARQARLERRPRTLGARLAVVVAALFTAFLLLAGSVTGALAVAVATGLLWLAWSRSAGTDRPV